MAGEIKISKLMKTTLTIFALLLSLYSFGQNSSKQDSVDIEKGKRDLAEMRALHIKGLQAIRHDALCRFKFRYAHELKTQINKIKNQQ